MALLRDIFISTPNYSNFNLSKRNRFPSAVGPMYPSYCEECFPGDEFRIRTSTKVFTFPTVSPYLSGFKETVAWFFVPRRLYIKALDANNRNVTLDRDDIFLPTLNFSIYNEDSDQKQRYFPAGSLADFLGFGAGTNPKKDKFYDATPFLGYLDIFRNYYANSQEDKFYFIDSPDTILSDQNSFDASIGSDDLSKLDQLFEDVFSDNSDVNTYAMGVVQAFNPVTYELPENGQPFGYRYPRYPQGRGLLLATLQPDFFTAWINSGRYQDFQTSSTIDVSNGSLTINQIRFSNHIQEYFDNSLISDDRYDDWTEIHFGIKTRLDLRIPELLAVHSTMINFDEIYSTANTGTERNGNLGSIAGKGRGGLNGAPVSFTASEHGYLMAIHTIIPIPSYNRGIKPQLFKTNFGELYTPEMANIGFQPLLSKYAFAMDTFYTEGQGGLYARRDYPDNEVLGYQPAFQESMTAWDEVHGLLSPGFDLDHWSGARNFKADAWSPVMGGSPIASSDAQASPLFTSYVIPSDWTFPFVDQSPDAHNFVVQYAFNVKAYRAFPKHLQPSL